MNKKIFREIRSAIDSAPRNSFMAEFHLQMIKYADELQHITAKDFCEAMDVKPSYGTEFSKMRNLTNRLKQAGLDVNKL